LDGYEFIAAVFESFSRFLGALAWPAAFVIAVWLFRQQLIELLPRMRVKHKDWEASFRLERAEEEAQRLPAPPEGAEAVKATPEEKTRFDQLAEISPEAAIVELRKELEQALSTLWGLYGKEAISTVGHPPNMLVLIRMLRSQGIIDASTSALLDDLRVVGNEAAHGQPKLTKEEAMRYRALADLVLQRLATSQLKQMLG
jgi:hypothetical protein